MVTLPFSLFVCFKASILFYWISPKKYKRNTLYTNHSTYPESIHYIILLHYTVSPFLGSADLYSSAKLGLVRFLFQTYFANTYPFNSQCKSWFEWCEFTIGLHGAIKTYFGYFSTLYSRTYCICINARLWNKNVCMCPKFDAQFHHWCIMVN